MYNMNIGPTDLCFYFLVGTFDIPDQTDDNVLWICRELSKEFELPFCVSRSCLDISSNWALHTPIPLDAPFTTYDDILSGACVLTPI